MEIKLEFNVVIDIEGDLKEPSVLIYSKIYNYLELCLNFLSSRLKLTYSLIVGSALDKTKVTISLSLNRRLHDLQELKVSDNRIEKMQDAFKELLSKEIPYILGFKFHEEQSSESRHQLEKQLSIAVQNSFFSSEEKWRFFQHRNSLRDSQHISNVRGECYRQCGNYLWRV